MCFLSSLEFYPSRPDLLLGDKEEEMEPTKVMTTQVLGHALWFYELPFFFLTTIFKPGIQTDVILEISI